VLCRVRVDDTFDGGYFREETPMGRCLILAMAIVLVSIPFSASAAGWPDRAGEPPARVAPNAAATTLPPLHLIAPADHARLSNSVLVVIETSGDMSQLTMGGMSNMSNMGNMDMGPQVHLHVVDGTVLIPSAKQMVKAAQDRYQFRLPSLRAGSHTIKVYWADNKTHTPVGMIQTITCTVTG
jgi:hypothetical protein